MAGETLVVRRVVVLNLAASVRAEHDPSRRIVTTARTTTLLRNVIVVTLPDSVAPGNAP
jgi:hypothetical protein